jgi:hypothetical protein
MPYRATGLCSTAIYRNATIVSFVALVLQALAGKSRKYCATSRWLCNRHPRLTLVRESVGSSRRTFRCIEDCIESCPHRRHRYHCRLHRRLSSLSPASKDCHRRAGKLLPSLSVTFLPIGPHVLTYCMMGHVSRLCKVWAKIEMV